MKYLVLVLVHTYVDRKKTTRLVEDGLSKITPFRNRISLCCQLRNLWTVLLFVVRCEPGGQRQLTAELVRIKITALVFKFGVAFARNEWYRLYDQPLDDLGNNIFL